MFETMEKLIAGFPADLRVTSERLRGLSFPNVSKFNNVLITGLGGSGIGGSMVAETLSSVSEKPIIVNKDYDIPVWVDEKTLVIACSYSGNTEETISAANDAVKRGAQMAAITSGGQLLENAKKDNWPCVELPEGYPPRAAFGHSSAALFAMLAAFDLSPWNADTFIGVAEHLDRSNSEIRELANALADAVNNRISAIYAAEGLGSVAVRWRQQINENAKMLCWHHVLPEMNHNELVGWAGGDSRLAVILLRKRGRQQEDIDQNGPDSGSGIQENRCS